MQARRRLDHMADLARLQLEGGILKLLLHVSLAEESQVAHLPRATAVRLADGQVAERRRPAADARLVRQQDGHGLVLGTCDFRLRAPLAPLPIPFSGAPPPSPPSPPKTTHRQCCVCSRHEGATDLSPAAGPPRILVLDQQVAGADLALVAVDAAAAAGLGPDLGRAVVRRHVLLELLRVGPRRRLPPRRRRRGVEVVWQVLGVGVTHFPSAGESCFGLAIMWQSAPAPRVMRPDVFAVVGGGG